MPRKKLHGRVGARKSTKNCRDEVEGLIEPSDSEERVGEFELIPSQMPTKDSKLVVWKRWATEELQHER